MGQPIGADASEAGDPEPFSVTTTRDLNRVTRRVARAIRATLAPDPPPESLGVNVRTWSEPADEVGGELADVIVVPPTQSGQRSG